MKVTIDIAGFFFEREVEISEGATVREVMEKAVSENGANDSKLFFDTEGLFVDGIYVVHSNGSAESRQNRSRIYDDGAYGFIDDPVNFENGKFVPADNSSGYDGAVVAWQYYIYDDKSVDLNRANGTDRKVVSFTNSDSEYPLKDGYTIVWRAILLQLKPNGVVKMKSGRPMLPEMS